MMTPERWSEIEKLFYQAADYGPEQRAALLAGVSPEVRAEVEKLLASDGRGNTVVEDAIAEGRTLLTEAPPLRFGNYRVTGTIGQGGMGAVYRAVRDDGAFDKEVAIKVLHLGMETPAAVERFRQERQILAGLEHPNIARLVDGGETPTGLPYIVLEYVEGEPITEYCARQNLSREQRLRLFLRVCEAVEYAHRNLIVHRDLKPGNILAMPDGTPKLLDFGIAKLLDTEAQRTITMYQALTPDYASPEQVRGQAISTASDVYSLGVVLYELLTGRRPYQIPTMTPFEIDRVVCEVEPAPPHISEDLDNILMMALRKESARRYQSVRQLADDIERSLTHRPVLARPDAIGYRTKKYVRRNWIGITAAAAILITMGAGVVATQYQARRAERRFAQVRRLANRFLFEFDQEIQNIPGTTKARALLVKTALEYLDSLTSEASDDRSLRLELATAYVRVGAVQGYPSIPNLGQMDAAMVSYRKAIALLDPVAAQDNATRPELRVLNQAWEELSQVQHALHLSDSVHSVEQSLRFGRLLCAGTPDQPTDYNTVSAPLTELAFNDEEEGRVADARKHFEEALEFRELLAAAAPSPATDWRLAGSFVQLARTQHRLGDLEGAAAGITRAKEYNQRALAKEPNNVRYRRNGFFIANLEANLLGHRSQPSFHNLAAAQAAATVQLELADRAAQADPNSVLAKFDVLAARSTAGEVYLTTHSDRVVNWMRSSLDIVAELRQRGHSPEQLGAFDRDVRAGLGEALVYQDRLAEAKPILENVATEEEEVAARSAASSFEYGRLILAHLLLGHILFQTGKVAEATTHLDRARSLAEGAAKAHPGDIRPQCDLSECYRQIADIWKKAHSTTREREVCEQNLALWRSWNHTQQAYRYSREREAEAAARVAGIVDSKLPLEAQAGKTSAP
jgi:hypothetical protein